MEPAPRGAANTTSVVVALTARRSVCDAVVAGYRGVVCLYLACLCC